MHRMITFQIKIHIFEVMYIELMLVSTALDSYSIIHIGKAKATGCPKQILLPEALTRVKDDLVLDLD